MLFSVPEAALAIFVVYMLLGFGVRSLVQRSRTADTGYRDFGARPGSVEWLAGMLLALAIMLALGAPVLELAGVIEPVGAFDTPALHLAGLGLAVLGAVVTLVSQGAMGRSWRVGVDPGERTALVTSGSFALVRNPVFAGVLVAGLGLMLIVPNPVGLAAFVAIAIAVELQTRLVEEPYLLRVHGRSYSAYAARVGRFLPWIGRLRAGAGVGPEGVGGRP